MKTKFIFLASACAGLLLSGCKSGGEKKADRTTDDSTTTATIVGNDKDEHGCIASAGYTWSEVQKDCIRLWEKGVRTHAVDNTDKTLFLIFAPDSAQVELFFSEKDASKEILDRRTLPSGAHVWNVEDDDTKNVRLENGKWTVSQRGKVIYLQENAD